MKKTFFKLTCIVGALGIMTSANAAYANAAADCQGGDGPPDLLQCTSGDTDQIERYIVKFSQTKAFAQGGVKEDVQDGLAGVERLADKWYSAKANGLDRDAVIQNVSRLGKVEYIEEDLKREKASFDTGKMLLYEPENWGVKASGCTQAVEELSSFYIGEEVIVAVLDTGVWKEHPLLEGRTVDGYDFYDNDSDPSDTDGHGTHVAGIVASATQGLPVKIMPIRVMDSNGGYDSVIGQGIQYAVDSGADVINMSLAGEGRSQYLEDMVEYANSNGVVVVVSAGNDSRDTSEYYPAGIEQCITVSAVDRYDGFADFSNFGEEVDIAAPGVDIVSSTLISADYDGRKDGYASFDGTSMAAPFVAAEAAIIKLDDERLLPYEIEYLILENARDAGEAGDDPYFGHGIMDFGRWMSQRRFAEKGKIELVNGPKNIFEGSTFLIKYRAKPGYRPGVSVEYGGNTLQAQVEYPEEGYASITTEEKLPSGTVTVNIDNYSYEANVKNEQSEFSITSESEITLLFSGVKPIGEIHSENLYIRGPNGYRMDFNNIEPVEGGVKVKLGYESGLLYGRCSIVIEDLNTDKGEIDQIIPTRLYSSK